MSSPARAASGCSWWGGGATWWPVTPGCGRERQRDRRPGRLSRAGRDRGRPRRDQREQAASLATRLRYQMADTGMAEAEPESTTDASAPPIFRMRTIGTAVGGRHALSVSTRMADRSCAALATIGNAAVRCSAQATLLVLDLSRA